MLLRHAADDVVEVQGAGNAPPRTPPSAEPRRAPRRRVLKAAIAAWSDRRLTTSCSVRDLSPTGARLRTESSIGMPDTFELIIETDGLEADCQVVWRKANEVGVKLLSAPRTTAPKRVQVVSALVPAQAASLRRKPKPSDRAA
jgi:hypothetical protein